MLDLLERIRHTPTFKKIDLEAEAQILTKRQVLAEQLAKARADDQGGAKFAKAAYAATAKRIAAESALEAAKDSEARAQAEWSGASVTVERITGRLERELQESASPRIDLAISHMRIRWENAHTYSTGITSIGDKDHFSASGERLARIQAGITELIALKLEALDPEQLTARIDAIEDAAQ